jgi:hypothetical protein
MGLLQADKFNPSPDLDGNPEFEIRWFRYNFGYPIIDSYAKVNWEHITQCTNYISIGKDKIKNDYEQKGEAIWAYLNKIDNTYVDIEEWPDTPFETETEFFEKVTFTPLMDFMFAPNIS